MTKTLPESLGGFKHNSGRSAVDCNNSLPETIRLSIVGMASPVLGVITSYQEQIEWHLRVASLVVGLAVGVISLVSMVRKMRRR